MTWSDIWGFLCRWLWLFAIGALLGGASSYLLTTRMPKVYESSAKLLVSPGPSTTAAAAAPDYNSVLVGERLTATYGGLAKTRPVVEAALQAGQLDLSYDDVEGSLDATPVPNTQFIQITARATHAQQAADLANLLAASLIQQAEAGQSRRFAASKDTLEKRLGQLSADISTNTDQLGGLRSQFPSPERDGQIARMEFELNQAQQNYAQLERSYQDLQLAEANSSDILTVVDPATPARVAVQPKTLVNVVLGVILGVLLAGGVGGLVESLDDRLTSSKQIARYTGLPLAGVVTRRRDGMPVVVNPSAVSASGLSDVDHLAGAAESFRLMSVRLQIAAGERPLRSLLVTSPHQGEGKTITATNLAVVMAQSGKKVVLVDADLRAPTLHTLFDAVNGAGLTSLLTHEHIAVVDLLVQTDIQRLQLLPSGPATLDPTEVLVSQRMRDLLQQLSGMADFVIVDSAPVLGISDSSMLAGSVDGVLFVIDAQRTRGPDAAAAVANLATTGAWLVGAVLNRVPKRAAISYQPSWRASAQLHPRLG